MFIENRKRDGLNRIGLGLKRADGTDHLGLLQILRQLHDRVLGKSKARQQNPLIFRLKTQQPHVQGIDHLTDHGQQAEGSVWITG